MNSNCRALIVWAMLFSAPSMVLAQSGAVSQVQSSPAMASSATTTNANSTYPPEPVPFTSDELDSMVAPIALYPDALVAQVLGASTFPDQVAAADEWVNANKALTGSALASEVNVQSWDSSVKALTQFPSVLDNLARNLTWTSSLGQAFHNQQADTMAAVQVMRAKAQASGALKSNSQIQVVQQSPQTIVIQPSNPQVVYVPQYNPTVVYGAPITVPLYVPPPMPVVSTGIYFGTGISIGAAVGGAWGGGGWGWHAWNVNWGGGWGGGGTVIYNNNTYISNRSWHYNTYNTYNRYNGYHAWGPSDPNGYHPGTDTHYGPNGGYHPNGYYGPNGHFHSGSEPNGGGTVPNGGANGNHGLIGGNGAEYHGAADNGDHNRDGTNVSFGDRGNGFNDRNGGFDRQRGGMSGNGNLARVESDRGRGSMNPDMRQRDMNRNRDNFSSGRNNSGGDRRGGGDHFGGGGHGGGGGHFGGGHGGGGGGRRR